MSEEYTPTTDEVRAFVIQHWAMPAEFAGAAFDRWLARHDAEVWDEGYGAGAWDESTSRDWTDGRVKPARLNPYLAPSKAAQ